MSRSSIFNFDLGWARGLGLRAPACAVALLAVVEIGVARSDRLWRRAPNTMVGAFRGVEREVIGRAPAPAVVFVGSSRMRDAVDPRQLEGVLGLPRRAVLNLAITGGTPYEALRYYRGHRDLLGRARVLVVGIEDWYWNEGVPRDEVELLDASLSDRWRWFQQRRQLGVLVGGVWRTFELQDALLKFGASYVKGVEPIRFHEDRVVWRPAASVRDVGPATTDIDGAIDHVMESYAPGSGYEDSLRTLLELARADGVRTLLVQLPLRAAYVERMRARFPAMQPHVAERAAALGRALGAEVELYGAGTSLAIPDDRFYDYGHLTEDGCRRMSAVWAARLAPALTSGQ